MIPDATFLPEEWTAAYGSRIFEFDGFISHRRDDGSSEFLASLRALGVNAWHDGDADIRVRRVQEQVATALRHSRYLVAYVTSGYADSPWTRAEIALAARHAVEVECDRILVFHRSGDIPDIPELAGAPLFRLGDEPRLAEFLRTHNTLPRGATLTPWRKRIANTRHREALQYAIRQQRLADPQHERCFHRHGFCLIELLERALDEELEQLRDALMSYICDMSTSEWKCIHGNIIKLLRSWAIHFLRCEYTANRFNAFEVLCALAQGAGDSRSRSALRCAYLREDHELMIGRVAPIVGRDVRPVVYEMSLLRYHIASGHAKFPQRHIVSPEVRLRLAREVPFDMTLLPPMHRYALARSSLLVMIQEAEGGQTSGYAMDLEADLQTLHDTVFRRLAEDSPEASIVEDEVFQLLEELLRVSAARDGIPLTTLSVGALTFFFPQAVLLSLREPERGGRLVKDAARLFLAHLRERDAGFGDELREIEKDPPGLRSPLIRMQLERWNAALGKSLVGDDVV